METDKFAFKKLSVKRFPRIEGKDTGEERFWKRFKFPVVVKEYAAVSSVHFASCEPYDYAVTSGSRVQLYSGVTNQVNKTLSRFKEAAYSGCFRGDGKLLAAGSEEGVVKIFDVSSRTVLRQCRGHHKPTRSVRFSLDGLKLVSGSDDTTLRYWDMATETTIASLKGHEDYVRSVIPSLSSNHLILSGSYDHALRLWDLRSATSVMKMEHGAPVESILLFPSSSTCVSAGGHTVKLWDLIGGGRLLLTLPNHSKTVTSLSFDGNSQRLITGGLDKYVKVFSMEDYRVIHSFSYPAPVLTLAMSPSDDHLVVGMTNRLLSIRHKVKASEEADSALSIPEQPRAGTHRYFVRGRNYKPSKGDYVFISKRKKRYQDYEKFLKKFKYKDALTAALKVRPLVSRRIIVYSLFQELGRRDGLATAISGRNEEELMSLMDYLVYNVTRPRYADLLLDVCCIVVDVYGRTMWESKAVKKLFQRLKNTVDREVEFQTRAFELLGTLDVILTAAMATQRQSMATMATQGSREELLRTSEAVSAMSV